jgi:hypothetical protein
MLEDGDILHIKSFDIDSMSLDHAPTFPNDEMTGKGNSRHPSYSGFANFCDDTGLSELFFEEYTGLMRNHPGIFQIRQEHLDVIDEALKNWKEEHPNSVPGFLPDSFSGGKWFNTPVEAGIDHNLARLIWFQFWFKWAIDNYGVKAAIENY